MLEKFVLSHPSAFFFIRYYYFCGKRLMRLDESIQIRPPREAMMRDKVAIVTGGGRGLAAPLHEPWRRKALPLLSPKLMAGARIELPRKLRMLRAKPMRSRPTSAMKSSVTATVATTVAQFGGSGRIFRSTALLLCWVHFTKGPSGKTRG